MIQQFSRNEWELIDQPELKLEWMRMKLIVPSEIAALINQSTNQSIIQLNKSIEDIQLNCELIEDWFGFIWLIN